MVTSDNNVDFQPIVPSSDETGPLRRYHRQHIELEQCRRSELWEGYHHLKHSPRRRQGFSPRPRYHPRRIP